MRAVVVRLIVIGLLSGSGVLPAGAGLPASPQGSVSRATRPDTGLVHPINIFAADGKDPRQYVRRAGAFAPIGKIEVRIEPGEEGYVAGGSKFRTSNVIIISPCIIRTTEHTIYDRHSSRSETNKVIYVSFGEGNDGGYKFRNLRATVLATGRSVTGGNPSADVADLKLNKCVGEDPKIGWMEEAAGEATPGMAVLMAGYAADRSLDRISAQVCHIKDKSKKNGSTGLEDGGWFHDCAARGISSSAPLFQIVDDIPREFAFHVRSINEADGYFEKYDPDHAGVAGDPILSYDLVADKVDADIQRFGKPNPQKLIPKEVTLTSKGATQRF